MQPTLIPGTTLQNRYRVLQLLGQGGFGRTYLAEDVGRFNEKCAVKELEPQQGDQFSEKALQLFQREATILYNIEHPQIPKFQAIFEENQRLFLVQDYIDGITYRELLNQRLAQGMTFSEAEVRQFLQADRVVIGGFEPGVCCRTVAESVGDHWKPVLGWEVEACKIAEIKQLFEPDTVRVIHNTEQIEKTAFVWDYYTRCQVKADMGIPIMLNGEMFGVLAINQCSEPRHWQPFEVDLLKKLGTQVEIAIQASGEDRVAVRPGVGAERAVFRRSAFGP